VLPAGFARRDSFGMAGYLAMERSSSRPVLIYDEECHFCCFWMSWCRERTGDRVEYIPSIRAGELFPGIPPEDLEKSVQYLSPDGGRRQFADAVFMALATSWAPARAVVWAQNYVPGLRQTLNLFYRIVARHRAFFSFLMRICRAYDERPPRGGG